MSTRVVQRGNRKFYAVLCTENVTRDELGQHERWCIDNIGLNGWLREGREFFFEQRHHAFIFAIRTL